MATKPTPTRKPGRPRVRPLNTREISVYLTDDELAALDARATRRGLSRAALSRWAILEMLGFPGEK